MYIDEKTREFHLRKRISNFLLNKAVGHGMARNKKDRKAFKECIDAIPYAYLEDFITTLRCIAEKSGDHGFLYPQMYYVLSNL